MSCGCKKCEKEEADREAAVAFLRANGQLPDSLTPGRCGNGTINFRCRNTPPVDLLRMFDDDWQED